MIWLMKHWKPALATALLLALIAAWQADRRTQYQRGQGGRSGQNQPDAGRSRKQTGGSRAG